MSTGLMEKITTLLHGPMGAPCPMPPECRLAILLCHLNSGVCIRTENPTMWTGLIIPKNACSWGLMVPGAPPTHTHTIWIGLYHRLYKRLCSTTHVAGMTGHVVGKTL